MHQTLPYPLLTSSLRRHLVHISQWLVRSISASFSLLLMVREKQRQRQQLRHLSPWQLEDIGLSYEQAQGEAKKHFWQ